MSWSGETAASRLSVKTVPNATASALIRGSATSRAQEDDGAERVALVHRRQERERDEHRHGHRQDERPRPRCADHGRRDHDLQEARDREPDVSQRQRSQERSVVRDELPAARELLHEPPHVPRSERQDREDVALVGRQIVQVVDADRRPRGTAAIGPRRRRRRRAPSGRARASRRWPRTRPPSARASASACGLVIREIAIAAAAQPFRPVIASSGRRERRQEVDGLVLAPPGTDVEDGGMEQDRARSRRRPRQG